MSTPRRPHGAMATVLALAVVLSGCAALGGAGQSSAAKADFVCGPESTRDRLNDGYSALYSLAGTIAEVDKLFYVKIESDDVQRVVEDVTDYSSQLTQRLQALKAKFPALSLDRRTTPPLIAAARDAQKKATLERFAPVTGTSGKAFERGILIRLLGAVDRQHYLAQTIAAREPDSALSQITSNAAERYAGFYREIDALLNRRFYR